jgi:hypothetical protein
MPAAPAAVAVMIYRLISLWLVLLAGWILFLVISARPARRTTRASRPTAVNVTTPTDLGGSVVPSDRIAVNLKTLRSACRSRKCQRALLNSNKEHKTLSAERADLPAPSPRR